MISQEGVSHEQLSADKLPADLENSNNIDVRTEAMVEPRTEPDSVSAEEAAISVPGAAGRSAEPVPVKLDETSQLTLCGGEKLLSDYGADVILDVECGPNKALLYLNRLQMGSKGPCILYDLAWLTPNEFQYVSGRETAKDWKRSIKHFGKSLKILMAKGQLSLQPACCSCEICVTTGSRRVKKAGDQENVPPPPVSGAVNPAESATEPTLTSSDDRSQTLTGHEIMPASGDTASEMPIDLSSSIKKKKKKKKKSKKKKFDEASQESEKNMKKKLKKSKDRKKNKLDRIKNLTQSVGLTESNAVVKEADTVGVSVDTSTEGLQLIPSSLLTPPYCIPSTVLAKETNNVASRQLAGEASQKETPELSDVTKDSSTSFTLSTTSPPAVAKADAANARVSIKNCTPKKEDTTTDVDSSQHRKEENAAETWKSPSNEGRLAEIIKELRNNKCHKSDSTKSPDSSVCKQSEVAAEAVKDSGKPINSDPSFHGTPSTSTSCKSLHDLNSVSSSMSGTVIPSASGIQQSSEGMSFLTKVPLTGWSSMTEANQWLLQYYARCGVLAHLNTSTGKVPAKDLLPLSNVNIVANMVNFGSSEERQSICDQSATIKLSSPSSSDIFMKTSGHSFTNERSSLKRVLTLEDDEKPLDLTSKQRKTVSSTEHKQQSVVAKSSDIRPTDNGILDLSNKSKKSTESDSYFKHSLSKDSIHNVVNNNNYIYAPRTSSGANSNVNIVPQVNQLMIPSLATPLQFPASYYQERLPIAFGGVSPTLNPHLQQILCWSTEEVVKFVSSLDKSLEKYANRIREFGVTGQSLPFLSMQHMVSSLQMQTEDAASLRLGLDRLLHTVSAPVTTPSTVYAPC